MRVWLRAGTRAQQDAHGVPPPTLELVVRVVSHSLLFPLPRRRHARSESVEEGRESGACRPVDHEPGPRSSSVRTLPIPGA